MFSENALKALKNEIENLVELFFILIEVYLKV